MFELEKGFSFNILWEKSNVLFIEYASGVYEVFKDRFDYFGVGKIVNSQEVVKVLNSSNRIAIKRLDDSYVLDWDIFE